MTRNGMGVPMWGHVDPLVRASITYELGTGGAIKTEVGYIDPSSDDTSLRYWLTLPSEGNRHPQRIEIYRKYLIRVVEHPDQNSPSGVAVDG